MILKILLTAVIFSGFASYSGDVKSIIMDLYETKLKNARQNFLWVAQDRLGNNEKASPSLEVLRDIVVDRLTDAKITDYTKDNANFSIANWNYVIARDTIEQLKSTIEQRGVNANVDVLNLISMAASGYNIANNAKNSVQSDVYKYIRCLDIEGLIKEYHKNKSSIEKEKSKVHYTKVQDISKGQDLQKVVKEKFKNNKIPQGIHNAGNTCYFNSLMQALNSMPSFRTYIKDIVENKQLITNIKLSDGTLQKEIHDYGVVSGLLVGLKSILDGIYGQSTLPKTIFTGFTKEDKTGLVGEFYYWQQQDPQEFLSNISSCFSIGSPNKNLFSVRLEYVCYMCGGLKQIDKLEDELSGAILDNSIVKNLADVFYSTDHDGYQCKKCTQKNKFFSRVTAFPKVLLLRLLRHGYDKSAESDFKVTKEVDMPEFIQLDNVKYVLASVINHAGGTLQTGHYTAHVRGAGGQWYLANDSSVSQSTPTGGSQPYLLFYERVDE